MFKETPLRELLTEKIKEIPERELERVLRVIEKVSNQSQSKKDIMAFAGIWKQLDTQEFIKDISVRRRKANRKREK